MDTNPTPVPPRQNSTLQKFLIFAIILILLCAVGFNLLIPILGIAIIMTAGAWGILVATIVLFCIGALLFFIVPGILIILISLFALGWTILAIALFPFIFPIVMPVFIILVFLAFMLKRR